jgi:hypothetical protein
VADVAEIQEAVTDELKKTQKEKFSAAFQKLYNRAKACVYDNGAYFELKKCLPHVSSIKKKTVLKLFDRTVYIAKCCSKQDRRHVDMSSESRFYRSSLKCRNGGHTPHLFGTYCRSL